MAKKFGLTNKPIEIGGDNKKLSLLPDDSKEQLKETLLRQQHKKEAKTIDISEYLPGQYVQKKVSVDILEAAPEIWNFFAKPSKEKIIALAESIYYNGLLQPIVVREMDLKGKSLQILAGHTRVEAYRALRDTLGSEEYDTITAFVFPFDVLSDEQAEDIVCDTNFMQRGTLSTIETAKCIQLKAKRLRGEGIIRSKENIAGKISEYYHMKRATVFRWQRIANLIPELVDLSEKRQLTANNMYKLSAFSPKDQEKIFKRAADYISNNSLRHITAKHKVEDIIRILKDDKAYNVQLHYSVSTEDLDKKKPILILVEEDKIQNILKLLEQREIKIIR